MKIREFIQDVKAKKVMGTAAAGEYIRKTLEIKNYIPFTEKRELCTKVLESCNTTDESGLVKVDSISRYILFTIAVLAKYTNLELTSDENEDSIDKYDLLCQNDLLNPILDVIGAEYSTCNNMLNMMMADIVANNNNIENILGTTANHLMEMVDEFAEVLSGKVESLDIDLSQINIEKYKGLFEKLAQK